MGAILAVLLANLPRRWWGPFEERLPLYQYAWLAGIGTLLLGFAIGIPGYLEFLRVAARGFHDVVLDPNVAEVGKGWALASLFIYLFATPEGMFATYLTLSGLIRFASAFIADDVHGDFILTGLDAGVRRILAHQDHARQAATRRRLEGAPVPDRLITGEQAGHPDVELVVLASRRKTEWETNSYLVQADGAAFRIGSAFDITTPAGLRTAYPLTRLKSGEAIRHAIAYELPPLWRGRLPLF